MCFILLGSWAEAFCVMRGPLWRLMVERGSIYNGGGRADTGRRGGGGEGAVWGWK